MALTPKRASSAGELKALGHPLRLSLLDLLLERGPLTATEAAGSLDQTPANVSWHLRRLAEYGFVRQATKGRGRRRPWKLVTEALGLESSNDSEGGLAHPPGDVQIDREIQLLRRALATERDSPWGRAVWVDRRRVWLDSDEARALASDLDAVVASYASRTHSQQHDSSRRAMAVVSWVVPAGESPPT